MKEKNGQLRLSNYSKRLYVKCLNGNVNIYMCPKGSFITKYMECTVNMTMTQKDTIKQQKLDIKEGN